MTDRQERERERRRAGGDYSDSRPLLPAHRDLWMWGTSEVGYTFEFVVPGLRVTRLGKEGVALVESGMMVTATHWLTWRYWFYLTVVISPHHWPQHAARHEIVRAQRDGHEEVTVRVTGHDANRNEVTEDVTISVPSGYTLHL